VERDQSTRGCCRLLGEIERARSPGRCCLKGNWSRTPAAGEAWQTIVGSALACGAGCLPCMEEHPLPGSACLAAFLVAGHNVNQGGALPSDRSLTDLSPITCSLKDRPQPCCRLASYSGSSKQLVLLGLQRGGGEMAMAVADYLHQLSRSPIPHPRLLRGGSAATSKLEHGWSPLSMVVGSRDPVAAFGRLALPRPPGLGCRSLAEPRPGGRGQVSQRMLRGMGHNGEYGPFSRSLPLFPGPLAWLDLLSRPA